MELDVRACSVAIGMASLDEFHVPEIFKERARVMRTVPLFLKGAFLGTLRVAFEEAQCVRDNNDDTRNYRAWKLFAPENASQQATLRRSSPQEAVGRTIPDVWCWPVGGIGQASLELTATGAQAAIRRRSAEESGQSIEVVQMGELSVAVGNQATLKALTDTRRRPPVARPHCRNLSWSRRGAAAGPSGMTADHLQPVLDTARDTSLFFQFATVLARGQAPTAAVEET